MSPPASGSLARLALVGLRVLGAAAALPAPNLHDPSSTPRGPMAFAALLCLFQVAELVQATPALAGGAVAYATTIFGETRPHAAPSREIPA